MIINDKDSVNGNSVVADRNLYHMYFLPLSLSSFISFSLDKILLFYFAIDLASKVKLYIGMNILSSLFFYLKIRGKFCFYWFLFKNMI